MEKDIEIISKKESEILLILSISIIVLSFISFLTENKELYKIVDLITFFVLVYFLFKLYLSALKEGKDEERG